MAEPATKKMEGKAYWLHQQIEKEADRVRRKEAQRPGQYYMKGRKRMIELKRQVQALLLQIDLIKQKGETNGKGANH